MVIRLTGQIYRLPSEAEWEYANRAGATSAYPWGMELHDYHANYASKIGMTTPVWHYPANAWGLYMIWTGNVWEWVQDSWHDNCFGRTDHSRAWESANNDQRVLEWFLEWSPALFTFGVSGAEFLILGAICLMGLESARSL